MPFELLVGAVVGAGLVSEPVRKGLRKGLVYSLAGALKAYDKVAAIASEVRAKTTGAEVVAPAGAACATTSACAEEPAKRPVAETAPANSAH